MVPYNCSPITYIRFCQVTFNNWNMKMIALPNTDCWFLNSGVITRAKRDVHAIGKDQWSKVKVSEVKTQLSRMRSLTPVWIHIERCNDAQSLMWHKRVLYCFSRSSVKKNRWFSRKIGRFLTVTPVWIHPWPLNDALSLKWHRRGAILFCKVIRQISRSHGTKIANCDSNWGFPESNSSFN